MRSKTLKYYNTEAEKVYDEHRKNMKKKNGATTKRARTVRAMYKEGGLINLINETKKYKLDIVAMQETHIKEPG